MQSQKINELVLQERLIDLQEQENVIARDISCLIFENNIDLDVALSGVLKVMKCIKSSIKEKEKFLKHINFNHGEK